MSDRRNHHVAPGSEGVCIPQQWPGGSQYTSPYPSSTGLYPPSSYAGHPSLRNNSGSGQPMSVPAYDTIPSQPRPMSGYADYHTADRQAQYHVPRSDRPLSMAIPQQAGYGSGEHQSIQGMHTSSRPHHQSHSRSHSASYSYGHPSSPPLSSSLASTPPSQYPAQIAFTQQMSSSQYPASPQRPFSCDMCALSFNRQHDLKRHRDTHTGEKPFLCNGGCGKTFTRKDALKRHQLVKRCGIDEGV
ncbi:hypothetical protein CERSUDRAFT_123724 [Gelatoporia subvermispora B]|uniref:C2H2-type domain-containing protein n=1 Tax=Ceriporiopsis subvermispora (strain B) TaxID=914234 RepID=M2R068_CERS8|nr:hypothetical protein CERSUDRAFT_123724 [Gelatoporia subvermispora B]